MTPLAPFSSLVSLAGGKASPNDFQVSLEMIESATGRLIDGEPATYASEGTPFRSGDVLFGKLRPYLAKTWLADRDGVAIGDIHVYRPRQGVSSRFVGYVIQNQDFLNRVNATTYGSKMPRANWGDIKGLRVPEVDVLLQQVIADFLDRETAQIDALVAEQQELVRLLDERKTAMSTTIIWGAAGHIGGSQHVIDPAPAVPAHWTVLRNKRVFRESTDLSDDGAEEMLTVSHLTGITPRSEKQVNMFEAESTVGYPLVEPGDLVINTLWGWMGALGVSRYRGIVSPAYGVYRPVVDADPVFLHHLYRSKPYVCEIARRSTGVYSSRLRIYPKAFLDMSTVLPPKDEQVQIAERLDSATRAMDSMIEAANESIALMMERRSALISAAVTGRIDPRTGQEAKEAS